MSDFCDPIDCSLPGSSVHGPLQARILEQLPFPSPGKNTGVVAISFSRGSSQPRNQTLVSCTVGRFFTDWAMRDLPLLRRDIDNSSGVSFPILNLTFGEHLFSPKIWQNINGILAILQFLLFFKVMKYLLLKNKYVVEMWWCLVPLPHHTHTPTPPYTHTDYVKHISLEVVIWLPLCYIPEWKQSREPNPRLSKISKGSQNNI